MTLTMKTMEQKLQKAGRKHSRLYLFCNFTALMIISAYSALMCSKTVQTVFPSGGDSRKQMYAIFIMTLAGCIVFTIYAAGLFFRHKSTQLGILMALGASRRRLLPGLFREVLFLSGTSALAGILAGFPFVWILWGLFRLVLVDSSEMELVLDYRCLFLSLAFFLLVVCFACFSAWRYLRRTNIMEVIREEHINEPVKELGRWCGSVGLLLLFAGGGMGYFAPRVWEWLFRSYAPSWTSVLYAPMFAGLYMTMLYTVVYGWGKYKKNPYKNIISRGMMKFQARQTVNNMLVVTLLIAGGCFAMFYLPATGTTAVLGYLNFTNDYFYQYRADQEVPEEDAVRDLARQYGLSTKDWGSCDYITLGIGGITEIEDGGDRFHVEYLPVCSEAKFLSEAAYSTFTGEKVDVAPGTYFCVNNRQESNGYLNEGAGDLTNMVTGKSISTEFAGYLHYDLMAGDEKGYYVLDSADYELLEEGLTDDWRGRIMQFNVEGEDSYPFAREFYRRFLESFDESCEYHKSYDRVVKMRAEKAGEAYWMDTELGEDFRIRYEEWESLRFQTGWEYQPSFRILLLNDYLCRMGVLYMMFLFIFIVCLTTSLVVCYTRCQTIALNNRYIFDDLKKLGAPPAFLAGEVRRQCGSVFRVPALVGMGVMYALFAMILYANDGRVTFYEGIALLICLGMILLIGAVISAVCRRTVRGIRRQLQDGRM